MSFATFAAADIFPLVLVEVVTLEPPIDGQCNESINDDILCSSKHRRCPLSAPLVKLQLQNLSYQHKFSRGWLRKEDDVGQSHRGLWLKADEICNEDIIPGDVLFRGKDDNSPCFQEFHDTSFARTYLRPDDPLETKIPCLLRGYVSAKCNQNRSTHRQDNAKYIRCVVTEETLVCVQHLSECIGTLSLRRERNECETNCSKPQQSTPSYSKLSCYDPETVQSLALRMSTILSNRVWISTDARALPLRKRAQDGFNYMQKELNDYWESEDMTIQREHANMPPSLLSEGAILVYNSHPGSGKTTLVKAVATDILKCQTVHVLSAASLLSIYGTSADTALESILHQLALKSAIKGSASAKTCIILDHFESFLCSSAADPYSPVLNAMAAFLNRLTFSLRDKKEFPFPSLNPLHNVRTGGGYSGFTFPLSFCLIGVITHRDDKNFHNALDALGGGRFHVPLPSTKTRCAAFEHAFQFAGVRLDAEARDTLPKLAASTTRACGGAFIDVARSLSTQQETSKQDLEKAMSSIYDSPNSEGEDQSTSFPNLGDVTSSSSTVGGNEDAKLALEDALALDATKRKLLASFGLHAPTGVILYGPPGTGKTLLARACALQLRSRDNMSENNTNGCFLSLKASDIVRPEVGNSEKLIVSAFTLARSNAPSVVFIDEFQALFGDREGSGIVSGQLASTLLQCMDDVQKWSEIAPDDDKEPNPSAPNGRIIVLAATNTPWMVDKAFLRPGRFDRAVHVGLPDVNDRKDILYVHTKLGMKLAQTEDVLQLIETMAKLCIGFSGADLASLCKAAAVRCLHGGEEKTGVTKGHFLEAYEKDVTRSSDDKLVKRISSWTL